LTGRTSYPVAGIVYEPNGTTLVSGGTVKVTYRGDSLTFTTNSSGQYILDLANLPTGNDYANGISFLVEAWNSTGNYYQSALRTVNTTNGSDEYNITLDSVLDKNIHMLVQKTIWNILLSDSMVAYFTPKVIDQIPTALMKGSGFPYIIVYTPTVSKNQLTLSSSGLIDKTVHIMIETYDKKQINVRQLADAIDTALTTNQTAVTEPTRIWQSRVISENMRSMSLPDEETYPVWVMTQIYEFRWYG